MKKHPALISLAARSLIILIFAAGTITGCTFDYGEAASEASELPDLVMVNVEYVRVRSSDPIARFIAERAERYGQQGVMKLENLTFEQYGGEGGTETNVTGKMGYAEVSIESGDIFMDNGVTLEVESEDIIIETNQLDWKDETRILSSGVESEVDILRKNGTNFNGIGFIVDARKRVWEFLNDASGTYIHDPEDDDENSAASSDADE